MAWSININRKLVYSGQYVAQGNLGGGGGGGGFGGVDYSSPLAKPHPLIAMHNDHYQLKSKLRYVIKQG